MPVPAPARPPWYSISSVSGSPSLRHERILPSCSARPMNGRTVSDTSVAATLTAKGTKSPLRARMTCSAMVTPALSWASAVEAPRWGVTTTEDSSNSGDSVVGSLANTSRPAPWHLTGADGLGQGLLVHDAAPRRVDDPEARLGPGQQVLPDEAQGLGVLGQVDGDEVGRGPSARPGPSAPHPCAWPGRPRRTGRRPPAACRRPGPAGPPGPRPGPDRRRRGSCRAARRPPTWSAPTSPPPGRRGPGGCCGPGPATGPWPARRPRGCSTGGR